MPGHPRWVIGNIPSIPPVCTNTVPCCIWDPSPLCAFIGLSLTPILGRFSVNYELIIVPVIAFSILDSCPFLQISLKGFKKTKIGYNN